MTQTFIGYKPNVGPVLKCLKYDSDNPLTLANTAYDRYLYNSENQKLAYTASVYPFNGAWSNINSLPTQFDINDNGRLAVSGNITYNGSSLKRFVLAYRPNYIDPDAYYPPIFEVREKDYNTGRVAAGTSDIQLYATQDTYERVNFQYFYQTMRVNSYNSSSTTQTVPDTYNGRLLDDLGRIPIGEWVHIVTGGAWDDNRNSKSTYAYIWDLPANNQNLRTFSQTSGLLSLIATQNRFALSRPGHDVNSSVSYSQIIDSNKAPNLCVMAGTISGVASGSSRTISAPPGIVLSETAVLDFMVKRSVDPWYVPGIIFNSMNDVGTKQIEYSVNSNSITVYNVNAETLDFRYAVFNTDRNGTSTGGNEVMFRGNDGTRDFIQIKKPGTSDPASRPNDILFDSRFPNMQIIDEGFIPASSFSAAPSNETQQFGTRKYIRSFSNGGFTPFLKFSIVFPNCITTPFHSTVGSSSTNGQPTNRSCIARLDNNQVTFWISPGNPSINIGGSIQGGIPDPTGIRYYIFGITTP